MSLNEVNKVPYYPYFACMQPAMVEVEEGDHGGRVEL